MWYSTASFDSKHLALESGHLARSIEIILFDLQVAVNAFFKKKKYFDVKPVNVKVHIHTTDSQSRVITNEPLDLDNLG